MTSLLNSLFLEMARFDRGNPQLIQHFTKVHAYARYIAEEEGLPERERFVVEAAAYAHDIGILPAMERYGSSRGPLQEKEGPPAARIMLEGLGFDGECIERVCWLIGHHHTYDPVEGTDHRILIEADFLVNLFEGDASDEAKRNAYENLFVTKAGKKLFREMFAPGIG